MQMQLDTLGITQVDGILLDLGVSSHQLDEKPRGFSYQAAASLDMRMDRRQGLSAADVVNEWDESALARVIWDFGEEPRGGAIARKIVANRPVQTTEHLAVLIRQCVKPTDANKALARVFQAIRIVVNDELAVLEQALMTALTLLRPQGRIAVLSYHSLEDRRVKRFLKYGNWTGEAEKDFYGNWLTPWQLITPKPIEASPEEVAQNPRARSAKLRVAEKK
jgi:16S rRNA (cytosine1402-N4)-methyltransferase